MLHQLLTKADAMLGFEQVDAHCDIPCKIYDPSTAIIGALTVVRMLDLMAELDAQGGEKNLAYMNSMARFVQTKEEHASQVKTEVRVIWGDYIKTPQIERFPQIHELTHKIMLQASKCKQETARDHGLELVELVNQFAEVFWQTKDVATKRVTAPYPPALEVVYPNL